MQKIASTLSVVLFLGSASGALAYDSKYLPVIPDTAAAAAADCPDEGTNCKLKCRNVAPPTGTRLGGHTECRTAQFWEDRMQEDQARAAKIQADSFRYPTPGG